MFLKYIEVSCILPDVSLIISFNLLANFRSMSRMGVDVGVWPDNCSEGKRHFQILSFGNRSHYLSIYLNDKVGTQSHTA